MKRSIIIIVALAIFGTASAQNDVQKILNTIEQNNTTLQTLRKTVEADKLANRTGIFLEGPEIGFNYLWGSPVATGNRQDISVSQSFDFATISGLKSSAANEQNDLMEWKYKIGRMNILLEAKEYCIDIIYYNALLKELNTRLIHAQSIANSHKDRLSSGEGNALEYNDAQLNLSSVKGEISRIETKRNTTLSQLARLNSGERLMLETDTFDTIELTNDFESWFDSAAAKSPVLAYVKQEIEIGRRHVSLSKAQNLPKLTAGYMSEKVVGQRYDGVSLGVSVPLWENKNRIEQAKVKVQAAELRSLDAREQFHSQLEILYQRTLGLRETAKIFRQSLSNANNHDLLKTALEAGQISMPDYILQIGIYYDAINQALEAERDYQKAFAELSAVEL